ncbi:MAG: BF3164 family lipoprotein [Gemmatimonadota bacterium]
MLSILLALACADPLPPEFDHTAIGLGVTSLRSTLFSADSLLGLPIHLETVPGHLIVTDLVSDVPIHVFDIRRGARTGRYGSRGEGPGQFLRPTRPFWAPEDSTVWVFDRRLKRMTGVPLSDMLESRAAGATLEPATVLFDPNGGFLSAQAVGDSSWVAVGALPADRFARISNTGEVLETFGDRLGAPDMPATAAAQAYQPVLAPTTVENTIAVAGTVGGFVDFCDLAGSCRSAHVPFPFDPVFELRTSGSQGYVVFGDDARRAYIDVDATAGHVYALFSGRSFGRYNERAAFGRYVHVFDWEGSLEAVWELDRDAIALAISEDTGVLFAAIHEPLPAVVAYQVPCGGC